jgi:hypothetical protein
MNSASRGRVAVLSKVNMHKEKIEQSRSRVTDITFGITLVLGIIASFAWGGALVWLGLHMLDIV